MRKKYITDELASLTDTIENTVEELNKKLSKEDRFKLVVDLLVSLKYTRDQIMMKCKIFQ